MQRMLPGSWHCGACGAARSALESRLGASIRRQIRRRWRRWLVFARIECHLVVEERMGYYRIRVAIHRERGPSLCRGAGELRRVGGARSRALRVADGVGFRAGLWADAVVAENLGQAHALWHIRESVSTAPAEEGANIGHDISLPISSIPAFVEHAEALLARCRMCGW